ncbi:3-deoxy-7-phosphoheptulonate synthase [Fluoribacter gormanii]|uniref:Phospho-2-dehydro-3-deoxyheptonate aldolase n=1 Tax=Fluoribacter gormanii TaxID=464 RepID=A0A377GNI3_9GAMM|nr:3-deoxy-7-phosphoheptulonate synthase [Fluoribacter gormanii]KTD00561.1 phospho-2-dehydro-3-deoxyheptonate aldolase [Fluoribacter gormanii]SIR06084.1 3-deoxy-D-arabinoheptulosonate-7-phosphate synthase [Fluoribacter gormanii]STO26361.1 Phospho-2-dehydro-3-deoxyheptonate aldolase [Fluoribacter gormanii]
MLKSVQQRTIQNGQVIPFYHSTNELAHIQNILQSQTPLVSIKEVNKFRQLIARASVGEYFLIQSGDCAESFYECDKDTTHAKLDFIHQLATFFHQKTGCSVIQVGRIAGQYAKPRSNQYEIYQNKRIYSYFGDMINQSQETQRRPDPWRMLLSYNCSASIYRKINQWNRGINPEQKIYTSHEAFLLYYEQSLTRWDERTGLYYNLSTHFPWLGKWTVSSLQHINYLKKIANPIAVKIGPDTPIKSIVKIINELDPSYVPGRITLIPKLGAQNVYHILPQLIDAVKRTDRTVLWSCDPMHGNTETLSSGIKIRKLSNIVDEIKNSFFIHRKMGSQLNAIHLEATHQNVTECMDYKSSRCESISDLKKNYKSLLDPRLNYAQTMHVIQCVAKHYAKS